MGARTATSLPQEGGSESRARFGPLRAALRRASLPAGFSLRFSAPKLPRQDLRTRIRRPSPFVVAVSAVAVGVAFVAILTFYGAQEFSGRAADTRASNEAMSFAEHSSMLATGDAFDGYIQILRYADDPILNAKSSAPNDRTEAMQRLLYVNVNKFTSLTVADRSGIILATTDSTISAVRPDAAFSEARANLAPANSDIILPQAGRHGYVEYSAPLRDADHTVWGILIGRADPAVLWKGTLAATVDGSRNVIINSEGLFSAGVPDELLRQPWHGRPLSNGGVRADIAGVDSICGLAPIGKDTQMDRGLNVASCLPASLIQIERSSATDKQGMITIAGAVLAIALAALLLRLGIRSGPTAAAGREPWPQVRPAEDVTAADIDLASDLMDAVDVADDASTARSDGAGAAADPPADDAMEAPEQPIAEHEPEPPAMIDPQEPAPQPPSTPPPPPDIDALTLIDAYEQRNARLAERLRASLQAKLLVATAEADEAYKLAEADAGLSATMHARAIETLENIRERELRAIAQEMFPGLVRLGLSGALRAMRKELDGTIAVALDLDPTTDSVAGGAGRSSISPALRLVLYRFAFEATHALAAAGADACTVSLRREGGMLVLAVSSETSEERARDIDRTSLAASELSAEAYAGFVTITHANDRVALSVAVPSPAAPDSPAIAMVEDPDESIDAADAQDEAATIRSVRIDEEETDGSPDAVPGEAAAAAITLEPRIGLPAAIEALQTEFFGSVIVTLDIGASVEQGNDGQPLPTTARDVIHDVVRETLRALRIAEARQCSVSLNRSGPQLVLSILSEIGDGEFDPAHIEAYASVFGRMDGYLSVDRSQSSVALAAELTLATETLATEAHAAPEAAADAQAPDVAPDDAADDAADGVSPAEDGEPATDEPPADGENAADTEEPVAASGASPEQHAA